VGTIKNVMYFLTLLLYSRTFCQKHTLVLILQNILLATCTSRTVWRTDIFFAGYIYVSCMMVTISSYFVPKQLEPVSLYNGKVCVLCEVCLLTYIYIYIYTGHTQNNGAVSKEFTIDTAPFFCVCPVYMR
jgi:hypothetical protein